MNPLFNPRYKSLFLALSKRAKPFLILVVIAKGIGFALSLWLPQTSVYKVDSVADTFYYPINAGRAFGLTTQPQKASTETVTEEKVYQLSSLKLKAIYYEEKGGFIIVEEKGQTSFIDAGQVFNGYKLAEIYPRRAIFVKGGKQYELKLDEAFEARMEEAREAAAAQEEASGVQQISSVTRQELEEYKQNMQMIWQNIGLKENKEGEEINGFKVTFVRGGSIFDKLGLQSGDVLTEANGVRLNSYRDALSLYKQTDTIDLFKLTIERNGEVKELEYEIR